MEGKERLKQICTDCWSKKLKEKAYIYWLIEQAERAEKNAQDLRDMDLQLASTQRQVNELEQQNKRYEEALETIIDVSGQVQVDDIARQALEGDHQ